ncbi:MAG: hypothetical protein HKN91_16175 [Acidimicrobiia bacterium]|nr:hypothetical protein [Acidimicrobiia bacterium]
MKGFGAARFAGLGLVTALILLAVSLPKPPDAGGPEFAEIVETSTEVSAQPSLWYCPWINSGATRDTRIAAAFLADVDVVFTHPDPRVGEPPDIGQFNLDGPGAIIQDVAEIVNRGDAPAFVEFSNGPATAVAIVSGEASLSGDQCVGSIPRLWHIAGLTTRDDYGLTLRLFNPLAENAKVQVRAASELGSEALPDLQEIDVVGRTWTDIDVAAAIPFLDNLVLTVGAEEGVVIPTVIQRLDGEEANWNGTGLSTEWLFPTAALGELSPRLSVWNPGDVAVEVEVDLFSRSAGFGSVFTGTIEAGRPIEFPISDQSTGAVGIRVRASGPVSAVVVAEDVPLESPGDEEPVDPAPRRIAGTVGSPEPALRWLLPGAGGFLGGESSIWLLNTSGDPVTVTLQPLGLTELTADKVRLEPTSFRRIRLTSNANVFGYRIESAIPITASWSLQNDDAVALFSGIAFEE